MLLQLSATYSVLIKSINENHFFYPTKYQNKTSEHPNIYIKHIRNYNKTQFEIRYPQIKIQIFIAQI